MSLQICKHSAPSAYGIFSRKYCGTLVSSLRPINQRFLSHLKCSCRRPQTRPRFSVPRSVSASLSSTVLPNFENQRKLMSTETPHPQNRLALEKSPYLLQHASNPVQWYPWGDEAILKAKDEEKPIFLSVGYSTCHWCHVMERESFENEEIGKILNEHFISIKVDREERPDVDRVYMTFVQATTGSGGWPMSVFLTPDLKPMFGGTYFPPEDRYYGRPGFKSLLMLIVDKWTNVRSTIEEQGTIILDALMQGTHVSVQEIGQVPGFEKLDKLYKSLDKSYDEEYGGFGEAPKFPQPVNFNFLFRLYGKERESERGQRALTICLHTLKMMAKGGMHDHVSQGFHRYSTDRVWHVPHFEKMLYDQGQLAVSFVDAYQITKDEVFGDVARDIFQYVSRDLSHPEGGFYSAEDADSLPLLDSLEKKEGAFCVWTWEELHALLGDKVKEGGDVTLADVFCHHYSCEEEGNVDPLQDPHEELKQQNVLLVRGSVEETAEKFGLTVEATKTALQKGLTVLYEWRQQRPRPHLDDKMVSAWNGLMISAFARGAQVLGDESLTDRAKKAAEFLQSHMYRADDNTLLRSCYTDIDGGVSQNSKPIKGFADDYAFVIRGLLDLYEASLDERWLQWCEKLQSKQDQLFWDVEEGGYYSTQDGDSSIVLRMKEVHDAAEPSANSISCMNLLRLSSYLGDDEMRRKAERIFCVFAKYLNNMPAAVPQLACALAFHLDSPKQIILVGSPESEDTKSMLKAIHDRYIPNRILIVSDGTGKGFLSEKIEVLKTMKMIDGKATAYVCKNFACSAPTNALEQLIEMLDCQD